MGTSELLADLPVMVLQLALGDLLQGNREVVLGARVDHRRRELVKRAFAEVVVVRVDLARALAATITLA
jgi:hypothetical protein